MEQDTLQQHYQIEAPVSKTAPGAQASEIEVTPEAEGYELALPEDLPLERIDDSVTGTLAGFASAAKAAGIQHQHAQMLVEAFADSEALVGGFIHDDGAGTYDSAERTLRAFWRDSYDSKLAKVRQTVKQLGPGFANWLEETNTGNDPRAVIAISLLGDVRLTKEQAQKELDALTGDSKSDYFSS